MEETIKGGRYIFERNQDQSLGKGGWGEVFNCTDSLGIEQNICIKVITKQSNPESLKKQHREVEIMKELRDKLPQNPNLVRMVDYEIGEQKIYIIMEKCDISLLQLLKDRQYISPQEAVFIIQQIVQGYKTLLYQGILHRDIKPSNILYDKNKNLFKLSDFGLSRYFDCEPENFSRNIGTRVYAAPQVISMEYGECYSNKADIFSLGMTFYLMIYNYQLPYNVRTYDQLRQATRYLQNHPIICQEKQGVSNEIRKLIDSMLIYDEKQRLSWEDLFQSSIMNPGQIYYFQQSVHNQYLGNQICQNNEVPSIQTSFGMELDDPNDQWNPIPLLHQLNTNTDNLSDFQYMIGVLYFCTYQFLQKIQVNGNAIKNFKDDLPMYLAVISNCYCQSAIDSQNYNSGPKVFPIQIIHNLSDYIQKMIIDLNKPLRPQGYFQNLANYIGKGEGREMDYYRKNQNQFTYFPSNVYPLSYIQSIYLLERMNELTLCTFENLKQIIPFIQREITDEASCNLYLRQRRNL